MLIDQVGPPGPRVVALIGAPNCGKTTLYNWITGTRFKTVNYAGSTVETHRGSSLAVYGPPVAAIDTPGIYSLQPHGRDEEVTLAALTDSREVDAVIVVIDGTQLNRQLYLVRQVQELELPFVVAVTMIDLVKNDDRRLDLTKLSELLDAPVAAVDGRLGGGVADVLEAARGLTARRPSGATPELAWDDQRIEREVAVAEAWTRAVVTRAPDRASLDHLRKSDRYLLHPVWGIFAFVLVMGGLFSSIFWAAAPAMDGIDWAFGELVDYLRAMLGPGLVADFVTNGVVAGVGAVLVFVPQIFILFLGFTLLEDSGYLARAATIVDGPLHKLGLSGRSFVPILSGFACAVPAIMAARNIRSVRERWITVFVIPFMTCSARLPVYALLLTFFYRGQSAWRAGVAMTMLYLASLVLGAVAAGILNRILGRTADSHFLMELPVYRWPKASFTLRIATRRTKAYLKGAGPTILFFVALLWVGTHLPYLPDASPPEQLRGSVIGQFGRFIEPVFTPMGLDWRVGLGMMSAFVAREVFVSSLAVIFSLGDGAGATLQDGLLDHMHRAVTSTGAPLFTTASVLGLIVYFMIALQCLSTTSITWREMGSWRYAIGQLIAFNVLAYVAAVVVVQALRAAGVA